MNDASPVLLAVVEVDEWDAIACKAAGCNHKVFRAIHVVRADGQVTVLGSSCFKELYGARPSGHCDREALYQLQPVDLVVDLGVVYGST